MEHLPLFVIIGVCFVGIVGIQLHASKRWSRETARFKDVVDDGEHGLRTIAPMRSARIQPGGGERSQTWRVTSSTRLGTRTTLGIRRERLTLFSGPADLGPDIEIGDVGVDDKLRISGSSPDAVRAAFAAPAVRMAIRRLFPPDGAHWLIVRSDRSAEVLFPRESIEASVARDHLLNVVRLLELFDEHSPPA